MVTPDYEAIRKDLYERFHGAFEKLYVSELKDQIADKDEIITALNHSITELQAQNKALKYRLDHADWLVDKYREEEDTK